MNDRRECISIVTPMYNEEAVIDIFLGRIIPVMESVTPNFEIICVNDGSADRTLEMLIAAREKDPRIKVVDLSRNFGKDTAMTAGIDHCIGDAVIPVDADLQDPPDVIPQLVAKWREGYDVVLAKRADRSSDSFFKRTSAAAFYRLIGRMSDVTIPENVGDFRLMDRCVVDALALIPERTRFMKGIFAWLGFRQATVSYTREARAAGETKWRVLPLWNFALEGFVSFTSFPLKIWSYLGLAYAMFGLLYAGFIVLRTLIWGTDLPGYASLMSVLLVSSGMIMISLGVIGEYLARIFIEVKQRPLYLVRETFGAEHNGPAGRPDRQKPS